MFDAARFEAGEDRPVDRAAARDETEQGLSSLLDPRRPFTGPVPDSSVRSVRRVARLDSRTRVIAARWPGGAWYRLQRRTRFTREVVVDLRQAGLSEVVLKRKLRRASFPLAWLSHR